MVSYRIIPFNPRGFDSGEGPGGRDVKDVLTFRGWIEERGNCFTHTAPGEVGGVLIYAWSGCKPWLLMGEARVVRSRASGNSDQPHLIETEEPTLYPSSVPWLHGGLFVDITQGDYEAIRRRAFAGKERS